MKTNELMSKLDIMIPNPHCELNYNKDYELLIATVLSAQCTDVRVNKVTSVLFKNYNIKSLAEANPEDVEKIIYSCGNYKKKSLYLINIAKSLVKDFGGKVPNDREYLENLPGVGRKTTNVVLSNIHNVDRVSKRLGLAYEIDTVFQVEKKLMKKLPESKWSRTHHQLVLFGRYICKSQSPLCNKCLFKDKCIYYKTMNK